MAKIWGVIYKKLGRRNALGLVEPGSDVIYADAKLKEKEAELLDVLIHEGTHILQPYLSEEAVEEIGVELSRIIYEQGYRRVYDENGEEIKRGGGQ